MGLTIFQQKFYDRLDVQNTLLASIASNVGTEGIRVSSWEDVQRLVRMGLHRKMFIPGDQFIATYDSNPVILDVIGVDHDIPTDKRFQNSLTLQFHDCLFNVQFSAQQALYYAAGGLAAGTYNFAYDNNNYQFTLSLPVPEGGHVTFPWPHDQDILVTKMVTFESNISMIPIEDNITVIEGDGGTEISSLNVIPRCRFGSSDYVESAARQWLNSDNDIFKWKPMTSYDRPPASDTYADPGYPGCPGFLKLLDPDLVAVLGAVDKQVARNTVTDEGGQNLFSDKAFLLSPVEVYGGTEGVTTGEKAYPYYSVLASKPTTDALAGRIKYLDGIASEWLLRSPCPRFPDRVRYIRESGTVNYTFASGSKNTAPAFCIW